MTTATAQLELRDYQQHGLRLAHGEMRLGKRRVILAGPTGMGKRIVAVAESAKAAAMERDVLLITDRRQLVLQAVAEFDHYGIPCGVIMSGFKANGVPRVQVATIQTFSTQYFSKLPEERPHFDLILIDECHKAIEQYAKLLELYPNALVIGLTATPVGPQGKPLVQTGYADAMVEAVKNSELIKRGYLLPTLVVCPSEPDVKGVKIVRTGEYSEGQLTKRIESVTCFGDIFDEWAPFADRKTIVFGPGVDFLRGLLRGGGDSFYARGIKAEIISSQVKPRERERIMDEFAHGDLKVLLSVDIMKEGVDVPAASCAIDIQPNAQFRGYWQKVGRIKRPFPGQDRAVLIDMAGNYWRFPHPDDDPDWDNVTGDRSTQDVIQAARDSGKAPRNSRCPKCQAAFRGGKCWECGYEPKAAEVVRMIRMGNGKLKAVSAEEKKKKEKTSFERDCAKWKGSLFRGLKSGMTLKQCAGIHKRVHGQWPKGMPCCPPEGSGEWSLKVNQLWDGQQIMVAFGRVRGQQ